MLYYPPSSLDHTSLGASGIAVGGGGGDVLNETPGSEWVRGYRSSHGNTAGRTPWVSMSNGTDLKCVLNNLIQVWGGVAHMKT